MEEQRAGIAQFLVPIPIRIFVLRLSLRSLGKNDRTTIEGLFDAFFYRSRG